jgi:peptidoglycan/LPS O-acetylase OafA/YrhL
LIGYYSVWPSCLEIGLLLACVATPLFRSADSPPIPSTGRIDTLDGLRGFLALSVFFHHAAVYQQYLRYHVWDLPPIGVYSLAGQFGVSMFFMITGYLFYSQLLRAKGSPNWKKLYVGRIFRILPLYWFAIALVLIGVGFHTGWHLNEPPRQLLSELAKWSAGGVFVESPINHYDHVTQITADVTWTLGYEWRFYLALLALAIPARWRWSGLVLPPVLLGLVILHQSFGQSTKPWMCTALFLIGMSTASFRAAFPDFNFKGIPGSLLVVALLVWTFFNPPSFPIVVLGEAFLLIACGADLFGLLRWRPARRLGNVSYGIYLLQGPVLASGASIAAIRDLDLRSPLGHWAVTMIEAIVLVSFATCTHVWIERKGIDFGRRLLSSQPALRDSTLTFGRPRKAKVST